MKKLIIFTAAWLCAAQTVIYAEDTRPGRLIPLAEKTCFGYMQPIGDRLCLFGPGCTPIADYSVYSEVKSSLRGKAVSIDDASNIYFYNSDGVCFLTIPSGTPYTDDSFAEYVTYKSDGGYSAYMPDGTTDFISDEKLAEALEFMDIDSFDDIAHDEDGFMILRNNCWTNLKYSDATADKADEGGSPELSYDEVYKKYRYRLREKNEEGNYIIAKSMRGGSYDYGIMSPDGTILVSPRYAFIGPRSEGLYVVWSSQKYDSCKAGVTADLSASVNYKYSDTSGEYKDGLLGVTSEDFSGYIDHYENPVIDLSGRNIETITNFTDSKAYLRHFKDLEYYCTYIDKAGNTLIDSREYTYGAVSFPRKGDLYYIDSKVIYRPDTEPYVSEPVIGADNGEIKRPYYYTDIRTLIDGEPIQSYAVNGTTMIAAEDLKEHGFNVRYDNRQRRLFIDKIKDAENSASKVENASGKTGDIAGYTVKSDISAYVNGQYIETEAVDGKLLIEAETLCALPQYGDDDYWALSYLGISKYLMSCEYIDSARVLNIHTYKR